MHRLANMWSPFNRRLILHGIDIITNGQVYIARSRAAQLDAFAKTWQDLRRAADEAPCRAGVRGPVGRTLRVLQHLPPTADDFENYQAKVDDSAAGIDGLPYSAWAAAGAAGAETLRRTEEQHLRLGFRTPVTGGLQLGPQSFLPQGRTSRRQH